MKKLIAIFAILLLATSAHAWTLAWDDVTGETSYIVHYAEYPAGYAYPDNPAPEADIRAMAGAVSFTLPADSVEWDLPDADFSEGMRYVFMVQAEFDGAVMADSDYLCWTYPMPNKVIEEEVGSAAGIQINIYQKAQ